MPGPNPDKTSPTESAPTLSLADSNAPQPPLSLAGAGTDQPAAKGNPPIAVNSYRAALSSASAEHLDELMRRPVADAVLPVTSVTFALSSGIFAAEPVVTSNAIASFFEGVGTMLSAPAIAGGVAVTSGVFATAMTVEDAYKVHNAWKDAAQVLDGIKPDFQYHANLEAIERDLYSQIGDKSGVTRNSLGQYAIADVGKLNQALLDRKAEAQQTKNDFRFITYEPTWTDLNPVDSESRARYSHAEESLKRLNAAGLELADLAQKQAERSKPDMAKQQASEATKDIHHLVQGGDPTHDAQAQSVGAQRKIARTQTPL